MVAVGGSDMAAGSTGRTRSAQNSKAETTSRIGKNASRRRAYSLRTLAITLDSDGTAAQQDTRLHFQGATTISSTAWTAAEPSRWHICRRRGSIFAPA